LGAENDIIIRRIEATEGYRNLHNNEIHLLFYASHTRSIRVIKWTQ